MKILFITVGLTTAFSAFFLLAGLLGGTPSAGMEQLSHVAGAVGLGGVVLLTLIGIGYFIDAY
jgi:hypothetical protein